MTRQSVTTTVVPMPAKSHMNMASAVDCRTHPPDNGWPSWASDWMGTPSFFGDLVETDVVAQRPVGESNHEPHADVRVVDVAGECRPREHVIRAGIRLTHAPRHAIGAHGDVVGIDDPHPHLVLR